eukprot:TRINITY_DN2101_c0_g1_i1.p1 TRINITY_DN2101_c0_g1~~TRINITY_DN2101_c0_g1_i1.p1  ORF type:complete len:484 (-),score=94.25 TRINITY_DN2101_c0_g1_i1:54-1505(-)
MKELFSDIGTTATDFLQLFSNGSDEFDLPGFSLEDGVEDALDMDYLSVPPSQPYSMPSPSSSEPISSPGVSSSDGSPSPSHSSEEDFIFTSAEPEVTSPAQTPSIFSCLGSSIPLIKVETDTSLNFLEVGTGNDKRKKRKKLSCSKEEPFVGKTAVSLPRDQLLEFSSEDLENFVNSIKMTRALTEEEKKEISRQRRLIKNRESAMASRIRKKSHVDELEKQVEELKHKNLQLQSRVTLLELQNKQLQQQVESLATKNAEASTTEPIGIKTENKSSSPGSIDVHIPFLTDFDERLDKVTNSSVWGSGFKTNSMKATSGICLFILLFSFGLFFHNLQPSHLGLGQQAQYQRFFEAFSQKHSVLDFDFSGKRGYSRETPQVSKTGRVLLEHEQLDLTQASPGVHRNTCCNNDNSSQPYEMETSSYSEEAPTKNEAETSRVPASLSTIPVVAEIVSSSVDLENSTLEAGEIHNDLSSGNHNSYKLL